MFVFLDFSKCFSICLYLSQEETYDLHDRKAFAKFLIDADIRLVSWTSQSVDSYATGFGFGGVVWLRQAAWEEENWV